MKNRILNLLFLLAIILPACKSGDATHNVTTKTDVAPESVKDWTVVWDKQVRNGNTYLLTQNVEGFSDVLEGIRLYKYPSTLDQSLEKYNGKYLVFDEGVDNIDRSKRGDHHRAVKRAKLDLQRKSVTVVFSTGINQKIDVSKYDF